MGHDDTHIKKPEALTKTIAVVFSTSIRPGAVGLLACPALDFALSVDFAQSRAAAVVIRGPCFLLLLNSRTL
jgi:hypothetical protein